MAVGRFREAEVQISEQLWRAKAAFGKLRAGVPLGGERVWPGQANDLFVAHLSIYHFFSRFCAGKSVLDVGCGLGYGSYFMASTGSQKVVGTDIDERAIRFAKRRYQAPNLEFRVEDCERLDLPAGAFDLVVSSNTMEHLESPERFLRAAKLGLQPTGSMVLAVPPITNEQLLADNQENPHHLSNLTIDEWLDLFSELDFDVEHYRHTHPAWRELDFASYQRSRFHDTDFLFEQSDREGLVLNQTLTAIFLLSLR